MNAVDRFLRFAAECEVMAKLASDRDSKVTWRRLAQRWLRCAALADRDGGTPRPRQVARVH
jgi:hypothetical protein